MQSLMWDNWPHHWAWRKLAASLAHGEFGLEAHVL
jgi:hypothetical protein